ncbi:MAG: class I SAM-dependent methyltransferase [Chloroflexota bacterium]
MQHLKSFLKPKQKPGNSQLSSVSPQAMPSVPESVFHQPELGNWYHPVIISPTTVGSLATSPTCLHQVIEIVKRLEPDDYVRYLLSYYRTGLERFGELWHYADIVTVLLASTVLIKPMNYLEIGVRRGRSMAMVAAKRTECNIVGIDMWENTNYAGMPNPGPNFVEAELSRLGYKGQLKLIVGDSHQVLPAYFSKHPDLFFDLITVDGDHSEKGAEQDLRDVVPHLKVGGILVFDDISHPAHPYLAQVWHDVIESDACFSSWQYSELGYGVTLAIRKTM